MKSPREILLESAQKQQLALDEIRAEVVRTVGSREGAQHAPQRAGLIEVLLAIRWRWAAVAGAWLVILGLHFSGPSIASPMGELDVAPNDGYRASLAFRAHQELLRETLELPSMETAVQAGSEDLRYRPVTNT